ncbi:MAG TPA: FG-GAP-like repeat-containing protein [Ignavibacteriaceae bacterium]|nr:FG-GAP-like repeat-containing protein [Ignavibacteriaceae bacterium]
MSDSEGILENIFSGGHNNLEHQFVDIDGDGDLDIFYLDSDQTFGWFKNIGNKFNPNFEYSLENPPGLDFLNWFYFVDIDGDTDLDYFTSNTDQISFYKNEGSANSPFFVLAQDTVFDNEGDPIYSEFGSNPIFVDVDGDGDYDFISGNSAGTLTFFENIGSPQNFNLKFITNIWQNIIIIGGIIDDPRHGASSIDFVDIDNDLDLDLFWGDFFSNSLYVIENQGTPTNPQMQRVSDIYPINSDSVNTSGFNMPRFTDIDGDGDYDLFVSVLYDPTVPQSLMFYENTGSTQSANHILRTNDFLKTLDVGNNSAPVFVDIDNDGDLDLFVGSLNNPNGSLHFLENTGTASNPSFYYSDSSFFNITSDLSVSPVFGDIDNDGDFDLFIGKLNGTIEVYLNTGSPASPLFLNGTVLQNNLGQVIDVGSSSTPFLIDVDGDSDLDLVIGGFNGRFSFYENTGSPTSYEFTSNPSYFGTLDIGDNSTPFLIDYNKDGALDLFSGSRKGELFYFRNDGSNSAPVWTEVTNQFIQDNFGGNTFPCFVDIDNDTDLDLFLGNVKGGLYLYINSEITNIADWGLRPIENFSLEVYPNPFNPRTQIRIENKEAQFTTIDIFNSLGEKVKSLHNDYMPASTHYYYWYGENNSGEILPSGVYFILASSELNTKAIKVLFLK